MTIERPPNSGGTSEIGGEHHQRHVLHQDRESHRGEHEDYVRLVQPRPDDQPVDQHAEQKHRRHHHDDSV